MTFCFLDLHHALALFGFLLLFLLLVLELAVVNQLANRRTRLRRDFDQIHAELFSLVKSVVRVHDDAGSVRHRDSDLGDPDFTIQTMTIFLFCRVIPTICYHLLTSMLV